MDGRGVRGRRNASSRPTLRWKKGERDAAHATQYLFPVSFPAAQSGASLTLDGVLLSCGNGREEVQHFGDGRKIIVCVFGHGSVTCIRAYANISRWCMLGLLWMRNIRCKNLLMYCFNIHRRDPRRMNRGEWIECRRINQSSL